MPSSNIGYVYLVAVLSIKCEMYVVIFECRLATEIIRIFGMGRPRDISGNRSKAPLLLPDTWMLMAYISFSKH